MPCLDSCSFLVFLQVFCLFLFWACRAANSGYPGRGSIRGRGSGHSFSAAALLLTYALPVSGLVGLPDSLPRLVSASSSRIKARPLSRFSSRRPCLSSGAPAVILAVSDHGDLRPCQCRALSHSNKFSIRAVRTNFRNTCSSGVLPLAGRISNRI